MLACAAFCTAFVVFLVVGSPVLLDRTLSNAPPPAPQEVGSGTIAGAAWTAEAFDAAEGMRVVGPDGVEPIVDPEPCMRVTVDGAASVLCVERRGTSIRDAAAAVVTEGPMLVHAVVAPEVTAVEVRMADGAFARAEPVYVDFGFPLGFVVLPVDPNVAVTELVATDRDGAVRATAVCSPTKVPLGDCTITEGTY